MSGTSNQRTELSKLGLMELAKPIAIEGKEHNIFVNTVAPMGFTPGSAATVQDEQTQKFMKEHMPACYAAPTVAWLVHEDSEVRQWRICPRGWQTCYSHLLSRD